MVVEKGVYYDTNPSPDVYDPKVLGESSVEITGLEQNTKYYVKAYLLTDRGDIKSEEIVIWTYALYDWAGNGYHTVTIGQQTWLVENYRGTKLSDGSYLPEFPNNDQWTYEGTINNEGWCSIDNNRENDSIYGLLYNATAAKNAKLAPPGYRLPTLQETDELKSYLGENAGGKIKSTTNHWKQPNAGATNSTGFTALPWGARGDSPNGNGIWDDQSEYSYHVTQTDGPDGETLWVRYVKYNETRIVDNGAYNKTYGFPVRLVKDLNNTPTNLKSSSTREEYLRENGVIKPQL